MRDQRHWSGFPNALQQVANGHPIYFLDTLGNGSQSHLTSPINIWEYADNIHAQLKQQEIVQPALVGLSLGGMIALELLAQQPDTISGIITINSSVNRLSPFYHRFSPLYLMKAMLRARSPKQQSYLEAVVLSLTSLTGQYDAELLTLWSQFRQTRKTRMDNAVRQVIAASRYKGPDSVEQGKLMVLFSDKDKLVNPSCSQKLATFYRAGQEQVTGAGHDIGLDQPQALALAVMKAIKHWETQYNLYWH